YYNSTQLGRFDLGQGPAKRSDRSPRAAHYHRFAHNHLFVVRNSRLRNLPLLSVQKKSLILRDPDVIERLAVLRITKQANFPSPKGFVPQLQQLSRVQPSFYDLALNRHCNCDHTAGPIAFLDGPKLSVVRAFALVQSG